MSSKDSAKNMKKPAENTDLSWEKQEQLEQKYLRESKFINRQKKKAAEKSEIPGDSQ